MSDRERALAAICDTFVPGGDGLPSASTLNVPRLLRSEVQALGRPALVAELDQLLDTLESPLLNLALCGRAVRFSSLSLRERERYLRRWAASPLALKRRAFQVMKRLVLLYTYAQDGSPYRERMGYAPPVLDPPAPPATLNVRLARPGEALEADACVIGSGAGGAVIAAELAAAGKTVVVLERALLRTEAEFDARELPAYASLFVDRGIASTRDRAIAILAGSAVGGGTVVNWNTSLRLTPAVSGEWRSAGVDDLDPHYDAVERRLDIDRDESARNGPNAMLERGLRALGLPCETIPRNVRGCGDCGHCGLGCRRGAKQSVMRTYLADACRRGAVIIHGVDARTVSSTGPRTHEIAARTSDGGSLTVRARLVALAAGSIYTPALLMRSSVGNAHVGRHLHLHPVAVSVGIYDEDLGGVWSGVPQSVLGSGSAEIAGGYGFRIEIPQAYPGVLAASFPWWSGDAHRASLADARHAAPFIAIVRDRTEGRVRLDDVREPVIEYGCGPLEGRLLTRGMVECARIHEAAGASRQFTLHTPPVELRGGPLAPFVREIERRGVSPNRVALFSAHQMSSCRIGTAPDDSAADPDGQLWGRPGVYVTDASAFPSASGVNPMLTVMALARRTASRMLSA